MRKKIHFIIIMKLGIKDEDNTTLNVYYLITLLTRAYKFAKII